ncbi:uncharacterized protein DS421_1g09790 [Arachis hypogaea]|nr:uncharacterized protein DS421_1g09790 [Arachis hypogaea]
MAIRNLLPRKLDPPKTFNCITCFGREPSPQDHILGKVSIPWVRRCRDTEPCDTQESIERYVWEHIFCVLGMVVFLDKLTTSLNSKFLPLLRDFHRISAYSWGAVSLAHLYRSLCRTSRYNCKEMDGPLILFFVWAWERMLFLAPIPRDQLVDVESLAPTYKTYAHQFQHPAYAQQFQGPSYAQQFQDPAYAQQWPTYQQQAAYIPEAHFSQILRDTDFLSPPPPQERPAASQHFGGRRGTSGHASDFDFDDPTIDVDPPGPSAPPRNQLFDLNEYPYQKEGDLGYDLQHWFDLGRASTPGMSGSGLYDIGGASMTDFGGSDVGSGLDAGVSQGHPYNLWTHTYRLHLRTNTPHPYGCVQYYYYDIFSFIPV